jgi:glucose-1-phosphate thymidylyltransferase
MSVIGVIPAAGYATRLQPLRCSKEVLPVRGVPVMDYIIQRMRRAPCDELRVVTRSEKTDVIKTAITNGAAVVEGQPASLAESLLCGIEGADAGDTVLIGFPDSIWEPVDGYRAVLRTLADGWSVALGLFRGDDLRRYEPVVADDNGRVERIEFKPARPSSDWLWGCAAASVAILRGIQGYDEPGLFFDSLARAGLVGATWLSEAYLDIGTAEALREVSGG